MGRLVPTVLFSSVDSKERFKKGFPCFEAILKTTDVSLPSHTDEETGQHDGKQAWVAAPTPTGKKRPHSPQLEKPRMQPGRATADTHIKKSLNRNTGRPAPQVSREDLL